MATTDRQFFVGGIAFTPGGGGVGFVSRFTDRNNSETDANIHFDGTRILLTQTTSRFFVDKPSIAAALGPNGATYVYAAFVVFDQSDPLTSKIQLFRSTDGGMSWSTGAVVSEPLSRNQAPWIVIDPNDARTMYIGWRVFSARPGGLANAIVGRKSTNGGASFTTSLPYPVALLLKPFDQPQGDIRAGSQPIPRSNSYPTATIDGNGVIHVALQEYVYPANHPLAAAPRPAVAAGRQDVGGRAAHHGDVLREWRRLLDTAERPSISANGAGTQFMPVITAAGEPGPSCSGNAGRPRSRVMVMYYDARSGGVGVTAGGNRLRRRRQPPVRRANRRGQRLQQGRARTARLRRVAADVALQPQLHAAARHRPDARLRLHRRQPRLRHLLRRILRVLGRLHSPHPAAALRADADGLEADHRQRRRSEHSAGAGCPGILG